MLCEPLMAVVVDGVSRVPCEIHAGLMAVKRGHLS